MVSFEIWNWFEVKIQKGKCVQMFPKNIYMYCVYLNQTLVVVIKKLIY